jgi:hypothetical protein
MEEWFEYQHKLSKLDKSKIGVWDPRRPSEDSKRPNCRHCGHLKQKSTSYELFEETP